MILMLSSLCPFPHQHVTAMQTVFLSFFVFSYFKYIPYWLVLVYGIIVFQRYSTQLDEMRHCYFHKQ